MRFPPKGVKPIVTHNVASIFFYIGNLSTLEIGRIDYAGAIVCGHAIPDEKTRTGQ